MGSMIVLFTDFGRDGPYIGQMHAVLARQAPGEPVIDLFHDVPRFDIRAAAYLLPAYVRDLPPGCVVVGVVDPGVGSTRRAVLLNADQRWYVGPDNGLFQILAQRAAQTEWYALRLPAERLSASFHGRDLFAPAAAQLARGQQPESSPIPPSRQPGDWPEDLAEVVYIDRFGNALSGLRASMLARDRRLRVQGIELGFARTFSDAAVGSPFWYENANGLVELAVNQGRADAVLGIAVGSRIDLL